MEQKNSLYLNFFLLLIKKETCNISGINFIKELYSNIEYNSENQEKIKKLLLISKKFEKMTSKILEWEYGQRIWEIINEKFYIETDLINLKFNNIQLELIDNTILLYLKYLCCLKSNFNSTGFQENIIKILKTILKIKTIKEEKLIAKLNHIFTIKLEKYDSSLKTIILNLIENFLRGFYNKTNNFYTIDLILNTLPFLDKNKDINKDINIAEPFLFIKNINESLKLDKIIFNLKLFNKSNQKDLRDYFFEIESDLKFKIFNFFNDLIFLEEVDIQKLNKNFEKDRVKEIIKLILDSEIQKYVTRESYLKLFYNICGIFLDKKTDLFLLNKVISNIKLNQSNVLKLNYRILGYHKLISSNFEDKSLARYNHLIQNIYKF